MKLCLNICFVSLLTFFQVTFTFGYHINSRIAHGHDAIPHSAPYIISLQVKTSNTEHMHSCGGVILNEHWILTAGHCLNNREYIPNMLIKAGRHNIKVETETTEQIRKIHWFKVHEKYGLNVGPNDLALLYVAEPFEWTETVQPIALPDSKKIHSGIGTLFGWGLLADIHIGTNFATNLQTVDIPIISTDQCLKDFPSFIKYLDLQSNICTVDSIGSSSCSSDSGGPLVQYNSEDQTELAGIVSWGPVCGVPYKSASVFVRVSYFIDWIQNAQNEYSSENLI